ncbi:MAG: hypothetical protein GXP63_02650 [DPANN group archaeon]|nr:hypothetical protein [DPANN group archaeon]
MGRKAMQTITVWFIIGLFTLLILLVTIVNRVGQQADSITSSLGCKKSVELHLLGQFSGNDLFENINCPTRYDTITQTDPEQVKKILAEDYYYPLCDHYLRGKEPLFKDDGIYCAVDSVVSFDPPGKTRINGLQEYLATRHVGKSDLSYLDYCEGHVSPKAAEQFGEALVQEPSLAGGKGLDTSKKYAFVMIHAVGIQFMKEAIAWAARNKGTIVVTSVVGGTGAAVLIIGSLTNPIGWALLVAGGVAFAADQLYDHFIDRSRPDKEYFTFFTIIEYDKAKLKELGCREFPVKQSFTAEDVS